MRASSVSSRVVKRAFMALSLNRARAYDPTAVNRRMGDELSLTGYSAVESHYARSLLTQTVTNRGGDMSLT